MCARCRSVHVERPRGTVRLRSTIRYLQYHVLLPSSPPEYDCPVCPVCVHPTRLGSALLFSAVQYSTVQCSTAPQPRVEARIGAGKVEYSLDGLADGLAGWTRWVEWGIECSVNRTLPRARLVAKLDSDRPMAHRPFGPQQAGLAGWQLNELKGRKGRQWVRCGAVRCLRPSGAVAVAVAVAGAGAGAGGAKWVD